MGLLLGWAGLKAYRAAIDKKTKGKLLDTGTNLPNGDCIEQQLMLTVKREQKNSDKAGGRSTEILIDEFLVIELHILPAQVALG